MACSSKAPLTSGALEKAAFSYSDREPPVITIDSSPTHFLLFYDPPLLVLELLGAPHHHFLISFLLQLVPDFLNLSSIGCDHSYLNRQHLYNIIHEIEIENLSTNLPQTLISLISKI